jgi:hypothetical protein
MYFISAPNLCGGFISRKQELKEHCTYFLRTQTKQAGYADAAVLIVSLILGASAGVWL